ncbi:MAG TPA: FCD domain-containing protein [Pirellulales bacterium]|jgi:GntR family transcriptional repressor for pyruvate dehydrogenase complex
MIQLDSLPRPKIRDVVVERLKSFIIAEGLNPGDRLPTETVLAARFGVSRLSLREATKSLELLGILKSKAGVGLTVGQLDMARMTGHLGFHPALQRASPMQLLETRIVIETGALPHAARRMQADPAIGAALQNLVDQFRGARNLQAWIDRDIEFHRALLEASGLAALVAFNDLLQVFFQRFRASVKMAEWKRGVEGHQRVLDLLQAADVAGAVEELRSHIESHKTRMQDNS